MKIYSTEDSGNVVFSCNEMGILNIDLNNINLDNNFDEDDPDSVRFEKCKGLKKMISEELMPVAWHPKRWWNFCLSEDEKKEIETIFIE